MVGLFFLRKPKRDDATAQFTELEPVAPALYDPQLATFEDITPDALPGRPDFYAVIGVDPRASDDTIRYAYRHRASRLMDARWRPGRAARRLSELNAAYEILGKPDRRADYDRQRARVAAYERARLAASRVDSFPAAATDPNGFRPDDPFRADGAFPADGAGSGGAFRSGAVYRDGTFHHAPTLVEGEVVGPRPVPSAPTRPFWLPRPNGLLLALAALVVAAALLILAAWALGIRSFSDLTSGAIGGSVAGLAGQRPAPTPTAAPAAPTPTPRPVLVQQPVLPTATTAVPTATLPAKPTVAAKPTSQPSTGAVGIQARITDSTPPRSADVGVTVRLTRDGRPLANVPIWLSVYYLTVEERWPQEGATVPTSESGEATVVFNIGDATVGQEVPVVAFAGVEGAEPIQVQTAFTPR